MRRGVILAAVLLTAATVSADELKLKDGTKIVGTIVGFDDNSFKVETSYGFALVRKDKVASITISEPKKEAAEKKPAPPLQTPPPQPKPAPSIPPPAATQSAATPPAETQPPAQAAASPPPNAPPKAPAEPPMRETLEGNSYTNHTYGFRMYKPPSWRVIEGARKLLPSALVAMGTPDETTLLILGRTTLRGSLESHVSSTEKQLQEIYENFRTMGEERNPVAGLPAIEHRFRGTVDQQDWSGVLVSLARGNEVFTILAMTYAESDLIQIQENAIARAVASLEFFPR